MINHISRMGS